MTQRRYDENTSGNYDSHHYSSSRAIFIPITALGETMLPIKYYVVLDEFDTLEDARRMLYSMVDYKPRQCSVMSSTRCIFGLKDKAHSMLETKADTPQRILINQ